METNKNVRDGETECRSDGPSWEEASKPIAGSNSAGPGDGDARAKRAEKEAVIKSGSNMGEYYEKRRRM